MARRQRQYPRNFVALKRKEQAVKLRLAGLTYQAIGDKIGVTKMRAYEYIAEEMVEIKRSTAEAAEQVKEFELHRLDAMLEKLWKRRGDARVADTILRLMDRRSRYLGLDVAHMTEMKITGLEGMTDEQITARIEAIVQSARKGGDGGADEGDEEKA